MRIVKVIPSRRWHNIVNNKTASLYGAVPWSCSLEKLDWELVTVGWTWELDNGTIGLGRIPAATEQEAIEIMNRVNSLHDAK